MSKVTVWKETGHQALKSNVITFAAHYNFHFCFLINTHTCMLTFDVITLVFMISCNLVGQVYFQNLNCYSSILSCRYSCISYDKFAIFYQYLLSSIFFSVKENLLILSTNRSFLPDFLLGAVRPVELSRIT